MTAQRRTREQRIVDRVADLQKQVQKYNGAVDKQLAQMDEQVPDSLIPSYKPLTHGFNLASNTANS